MRISTYAWDDRYKKEDRVFEKPHEDMSGIVKILMEQGAKTILDLGCGTGRHRVFFAKNGFSVHGLDNPEPESEWPRRGSRTRESPRTCTSWR